MVTPLRYDRLQSVVGWGGGEEPSELADISWDPARASSNGIGNPA